MLSPLLRLAGLLLAVVALQLPASAAASGAPGSGFLWQATRDGRSVLLLGSIHLGRPAAARPRVDEVPQLQRVEVVALEANVFDARAAMAASERWAMYPAGAPGLETQADAALLERIERLVARSGLSVSVCCRMRPWMLANTLVVLEAMRVGLSPAYGTEAQIYQFALATGRPVVEIETIDEQMRLFGEAPAAMQLEFLRQTVEAIEDGSGQAEIERLVGAWERGDAAAMERLVAEMTRSDRAAQRFVAERLVRGRHPKMLAAIERFAASGRPHVVVIGSLHYFGPDGLLQMLNGRGWTVTRLP